MRYLYHKIQELFEKLKIYSHPGVNLLMKEIRHNANSFVASSVAGNKTAEAS